MSSTWTPLGTFEDKALADQIQEFLAHAGLDATLRVAGDNPPDCQTAPGQTGFVLWVQGVDRNVARRTYRRVMAKAFPSTYCEFCGRNVATHILTFINGADRIERHLCAQCYSEERRP